MDVRPARISARRLNTLARALLTVGAWSLPAPSPVEAQGAPTASSSAADLVGLWEAQRRFGPALSGPLSLERAGATWTAEIAGRRVTVADSTGYLVFELPDGSGGFRGRLTADGLLVRGHWMQPRTVANGTRYASPVVLRRDAAVPSPVARRAGTPPETTRWRGAIDPLTDEFTMYLKVDSATGTRARAYLRNPERNVGRFLRIAEIERVGDAVRLRQAASGDSPGRLVGEGALRDGTLSVTIRGLSFDFRRVDVSATSNFFPRGTAGAGSAYRYAVPPARSDGWPVGTPESVGLSRPALEQFVRHVIDTPIDGLSAPEIHGVLVARRGTLVLEEYFHGEHRDKPHDTRSAAKSVVPVLLGAAMPMGARVSDTTRVYAAMLGATAAAALEPRKRALTMAHLMTMSSGLDCDDGDDNSPGNEDAVANQDTQPDWWALTLALKSTRDPGERAVYCSINPHLAGGVIQRAAALPLPELFSEHVAAPLDVRRYWMNLTPTGMAFMGGGLRMEPRDFMKFGQLMLNGGTWRGRRVLPRALAERATSPLVPLRKLRYGYLWWSIEYPWDGRTVRGYFAGGNGGQVVMVIPELELVVAIYGGNYSDPVMYRTQERLVPEFVLPAVMRR